MRLDRAGALALVLACLAACGQKGPLRLPEKSGGVVIRPASAPPAPQKDDSVPHADEPSHEAR
ncbi:MAG: hypothetical protein IPI06_11460 [Gammaproteobacteria bacterium]|nr:hypothetical protein [Gammaproteobacteria bacterium]